MNTLEQFRETVPSLFAESPSESVSKRYSFIPTNEVVEKFINLGWEIVDAKQVKARIVLHNGILVNGEVIPRGMHKKHFVVLENPNHHFEVNGEEMSPRLYMVNSHDKSSSYQFKLGIYRYICTNGLVIADARFGEFKLTHYNLSDEKINEFHEHIIEFVPQITEVVNKWQELELDRPTTDSFVQEAALIRFGENKQLDLDAVNYTRRQQDAGNSLWKTFNRVQENLMDCRRLSVFNQETNKSRNATVLKNPQRIVEFNKLLWELASRYYGALNNEENRV